MAVRGARNAILLTVGVWWYWGLSCGVGQLVEDHELIWDDRVAAETCIDFDASFVPKSEVREGVTGDHQREGGFLEMVG